MLKNILCALALITGLAGFSQVVIPEPLKITKEDLAQKVHPQDSTAAAAYLYRSGKTWYEIAGNQWVMVTEVYSRIKIYKKEGYDYANQQIVFYSGDRSAKGKFSDANTYNLTGGAIEKVAVKEDSQFETEFKDEYTQKRISLPNVKEGSIIEFKYTLRTPYFSELRDFKFQFEIPANDIRYDVWIPVYFYYNVYTIGNVKPVDTASRELENTKTSVNERYRCYTAKNVKAFKEEEYVDNIDNYTAVLKHELSAVTMPNQGVKKFATDWKTVAKKIYEHNDFGRELKYNSYFEDDVNPLLTGTTNDEEKALAVFNYVKSRMNWNGEERYVCETGVKKAYEAKVGNTAEINLMLTAMLRYAGLDADPVLVSTRDNGVAQYPTRLAYNYVIAAVKLKDKTILLDATSKYSQVNVLPIRTLNWKGRLIKKNGDTEEIDLMPTLISKEFITAICTINPDGTINGVARNQYFDYNAYTFREKYAGTHKESYMEKMEGKYKGLTLNEYKITNEKDVSKPVVEDYTFSHNMVADLIGTKIYLNPMLFFTQSENPFKQEVREYPVDFVYPHQDKYMINFTIPDGYNVESLPKPIHLSMDQQAGSFKYSSVVSGRNIQLSVLLDINYANFAPQYYSTLKDFFQKMIEKQNEKIVLVKSL